MVTGPGERGVHGDRTAFDVALFFGDRATGQTVIGMETKYHEHAKPESDPTRPPVAPVPGDH